MTLAPSLTTSKARLDHWREFLNWVDDHSDASWVFRGLGDTAFPLVPGSGRVTTYRDTYEKMVLEIFERRSAEFLDLSKLNPWDRMAIAQHHGLPTRLLDWTTNPLVGAYFAVSAKPGTRSLMDHAGHTCRATPESIDVTARIIAFRVRSGMVIDPEVEGDPSARSEIGFVLPRSITSRIVTQGGLFSYHPDPATPWLAPLAKPTNTFDIPGDMRSFFQRRLFYLGVDPQRIMGGLDGIGGRLSWQYTARVGLGAVR